LVLGTVFLWPCKGAIPILVGFEVLNQSEPPADLKILPFNAAAYCPMPQVTLATRNVFVYDGVTGALVGGCRQFGTTSIAEFFFSLHLFIVAPADFQLYHADTNQYITADDQGNLQLGTYIVCSLSIPQP